MVFATGRQSGPRSNTRARNASLVSYVDYDTAYQSLNALYCWARCKLPYLWRSHSTWNIAMRPSSPRRTHSSVSAREDLQISRSQLLPSVVPRKSPLRLYECIRLDPSRSRRGSKRINSIITECYAEFVQVQLQVSSSWIVTIRWWAFCVVDDGRIAMFQVECTCQRSGSCSVPAVPVHSRTDMQCRSPLN